MVIAMMFSRVQISQEIMNFFAGFTCDLEDTEHRCHDRPHTVSRQQLDGDDGFQLFGQVWSGDRSLLSICPEDDVAL